MAEVMNEQELAEMREKSMKSGDRGDMIEYYQASWEHALKECNFDMAEYYKSKKEELKNEERELRADQARARIEQKRAMYHAQQNARERAYEQWRAEEFAPKYSGVYEYSFEWEDAAKREFEQNGESGYYKQCLEEAARSRAKGK